ncbi:hypothetical protein ACFQE1_14060, partial [Halobium palmae]
APELAEPPVAKDGRRRRHTGRSSGPLDGSPDPTFTPRRVASRVGLTPSALLRTAAASASSPGERRRARLRGPYTYVAVG